MNLSYSQTKKVLELLDNEIGYLEDNGYRYKLSGDIGTYEAHQLKIKILQEIKKEIKK